MWDPVDSGLLTMAPVRGFRSKASQLRDLSWEAVAFDAFQEFNRCARASPESDLEAVRSPNPNGSRRLPELRNPGRVQQPGRSSPVAGGDAAIRHDTPGAATRNARSGQDLASPSRLTQPTLHNGSYATGVFRGSARRPGIRTTGRVLNA